MFTQRLVVLHNRGFAVLPIDCSPAVGVLFWQNGLLQEFIPLNNIGTPAQPVYEGTPVNLMGFFASIPLGFVIYGAVAYVALRSWRRST